MYQSLKRKLLPFREDLPMAQWLGQYAANLQVVRSTICFP